MKELLGLSLPGVAGALRPQDHACCRVVRISCHQYSKPCVHVYLYSDRHASVVSGASTPQCQDSADL